MKKISLYLSAAFLSHSCWADNEWRVIATHATAMGIVLFVNLVFFSILYMSSIIKGKLQRTSLEKQVLDAQFDFLTKMLNRRGFERRFSEKKNLQGYLMIVDIDDFKFINDNYGHDIGDLILREVAARLRSALREEDLVARFGGEEFVIYTSLATKHSALELSQRLVSAVGRDGYSLPATDKQLSVTVSIGVAVIDGSILSTREQEVTQTPAYKIADNNLYKAKNLGKNRAVMN
ncbi:GGDEF domain-containing protein [Alteromonas lipolytica]|uniref:diguanylate cyclase n=1 Tax=Alteromonas lipolytica TaxID=1856405 RepID=A0A1E8FE39_9ALTE|nr:GGDEF domain-containing protein [Alteromonas lipolytica]OFI34194.1 hypothetical protein BFC17_21900 [Alteromonas lipolytica]GGF84246.1 hypothetical protein GCM10011338_40680 [Alteromonas lipolytica]